jgi:hypothetical protein
MPWKSFTASYGGLPPLAIAAFAVRCAKRLERLTLRKSEARDLLRDAESITADSSPGFDLEPEAVIYTTTFKITELVHRFEHEESGAEILNAATVAAIGAAYSAAHIASKWQTSRLTAVHLKAVNEAADAAASLLNQFTDQASIEADLRILREFALSGHVSGFSQSLFGEWNDVWATLEAATANATMALGAPLSFDVWIDPGKASTDDIQALFQAISDLNKTYGGPGLSFTSGGEKVYLLQENEV